MHDTTRDLLRALRDAHLSDELSPAACWHAISPALRAWGKLGEGCPDVEEEVEELPFGERFALGIIEHELGLQARHPHLQPASDVPEYEPEHDDAYALALPKRRASTDPAEDGPELPELPPHLDSEPRPPSLTLIAFAFAIVLIAFLVTDTWISIERGDLLHPIITSSLALLLTVAAGAFLRERVLHRDRLRLDANAPASEDTDVVHP